MDEDLKTVGNSTNKSKNESLSDNISLFQAIHVLQSKDNDDEDKTDTTAGNIAHSLMGIIINIYIYIYILLYAILYHFQNI